MHEKKQVGLIYGLCQVMQQIFFIRYFPDIHLLGGVVGVEAGVEEEAVGAGRKQEATVEQQTDLHNGLFLTIGRGPQVISLYLPPPFNPLVLKLILHILLLTIQYYTKNCPV